MPGSARAEILAEHRSSTPARVGSREQKRAQAASRHRRSCQHLAGRFEAEATRSPRRRRPPGAAALRIARIPESLRILLYFKLSCLRRMHIFMLSSSGLLEFQCEPHGSDSDCPAGYPVFPPISPEIPRTHPAFSIAMRRIQQRLYNPGNARPPLTSLPVL